MIPLTEMLGQHPYLGGACRQRPAACSAMVRMMDDVRAELQAAEDGRGSRQRAYGSGRGGSGCVASETSLTSWKRTPWRSRRRPTPSPHSLRALPPPTA